MSVSYFRQFDRPKWQILVLVDGSLHQLFKANSLPHVKKSKTVFDSGIPFHGFRILCQWNWDSGLQSLVGFLVLYSGFQSPGVLTIYIEKPEIALGKSNGTRHSVLEPSENVGCDLQRYNFSARFSLFSWFEQVVLPPARQILYFYVYAQEFHPGGLCKR